MGNNSSRLVSTTDMRFDVTGLPRDIDSLIKLCRASRQRPGDIPSTMMRLFSRAILLGLAGYLVSDYAGLTRLAKLCRCGIVTVIPFQCAPVLAFSYSFFPVENLAEDLYNSFHQRASWTHIFSQIFETFGNMETWSQVKDKAFLSGFHLQRPWLYFCT
jgi:hypothetical protein